MPMNEEDTMPVYLFLGFLEGGKTRFIQQTLEDKRFVNGDRTLLLVFEEGEVEYDTSDFKKNNIFLRIVEDKADMNPEYLQKLVDEVRAQRVMIEYNGMWTVNELFQGMPDGWMIYQVMTFVDANTFMMYNQNMRSLVVDKLGVTELVVFNRFNKASMDKMEFHKIVRGVSRQTEIAYEYTDGSAEYDDIEDPLPFDVEADHIIVKEKDFALWFRDINEEPKKYGGKTISFKCMLAWNPNFPKNTCGVGRQIMTCCVEDIQFCWLAGIYDKLPDLTQKPVWADITAEIKLEKNKLYKAAGPVLYIKELKQCEAPADPVATYY